MEKSQEINLKIGEESNSNQDALNISHKSASSREIKWTEGYIKTFDEISQNTENVLSWKNVIKLSNKSIIHKQNVCRKCFKI